jgi:hypothetical protein
VFRLACWRWLLVLRWLDRFHIPPDGTVPGLVPHNDPQRLIPTVDPRPGGGLQVVEDWWAICTVIGQCADLGTKCPPVNPYLGPQDPSNPPPPVMAIWCISTLSRGECEFSWTSDCVLTSGPAVCGAQATGRCKFFYDGVFDRIDPNTVVFTGRMCPATRCQ